MTGTAPAAELFDVSEVKRANANPVLFDFCRYKSKLVDMSIDGGHIPLSRLLKFGLVALVVYFSQIYPYVHFHHAHAESDTPVHVGVHPADAKPYHSHHGHGHDDAGHESGDTHHHNQDFEQHVDWHLTRTHSNSILSHISFAYIAVHLETGPTQTFSAGYYGVDSAPLPDSVLVYEIAARGPPVLG